MVLRIQILSYNPSKHVLLDTQTKGEIMKKRLCVLSVIVLFLSFLTGCASIVSKSNWPVNVQSNPTGAKCVVSKVNGAQLHTGETPMTLNLDSSRGFFQPAKYNVKCMKDGYQASSVDISADLNGWYIGNIIFGGLIGILIVDPATGAMWKLDDAPHIVNLAEDTSIPNYDYSQNLVIGKTTTQDVERALGKPKGEETSSSAGYQYYSYLCKATSSNALLGSKNHTLYKLTLKFDNQGILSDYKTNIPQ